MVATNAIFLAFAASALALPVASGTSVQSVPSAAPSPATTSAPRPFALAQFSSAFVENAVRIRSKGVPEEKASSVAKVIIDDALAPPQYTTLARELYNQWFEYGDEPDVNQLYSFATQAYDAYQEVHNRLPYWQLVNYVHSEATIFDTKLLPTGPPAWPNNTAIDARISAKKAHLTSVYNSIKADPTGSAALETLNTVANDYIHDFTFIDRDISRSNHTATVNSGLVESLLMQLMGTI